MMRLSEKVLVVLFALATEPTPAHGRPASVLRNPVTALTLPSGPGLGGLLRGPDICPGALLIAEPDGRLRTLELDDLAPLRLRLTIPF